MLRPSFRRAVTCLLIPLCLWGARAAPCRGDAPFAVTPAEAFGVLSGVEKALGLAGGVTADELSLFAEARGGKLEKWSFAEAALLASGAADAAARKKYLARIDALEAGARAATASATTPREKGAALLKFLHAGPMAKGYSTRQTTLTGLLETGKFNCVSSAVLYNVLARRLGLNVSAVDVPGRGSPGHTYAVLHDGDARVRVETTNPRGFAGAAKPREKGRAIGDLGLAAMVYYNRGVEQIDRKKFHEAAALSLAALSLDPANPEAAKNTLAALANWGRERDKAGAHEDAIRLVDAGLRLAPGDRNLLHNRKAAWSGYADAVLAAGKEEEAVAVVRRAAAAIPGSDLTAMLGDLYLRRGEALVKAGDWDGALALAGLALEKADGKLAGRLREWRAGVYLRRAESLQRGGDFKAAVALLEQGLAAEPGDGRLANNIGYLAQEWAKTAAAKGGAAEAITVLREMRKRFPRLTEVGRAAAAHAGAEAKKHLSAKRYPDALDCVERYREALEEDQARALTRTAYDTWAGDLMGKKDWRAAAGVYLEALKKVPGDSHLRNNAVATYDRWARTHYAGKDWNSAIGVYEEGLQQLPGERVLTHNLEYCKQQRER